MTEFKKKIAAVFACSAMIMTVAWTSAAVAQEAETEGDPGGGVIEKIMMVVSRPDMDNSVMLTWWTDEVWALMAYSDKGADALAGYNLTSVISRNYILFSQISMGAEVPKLAGVPVLKTSKGLKVNGVKVHSSVNGILPNLVAFPMKDAKGTPLLGPGVKSFSVTLKYAGAKKPSVFKWELPLSYPAEKDEAYDWIKTQMSADPETMQEQDVVFKYLGPHMKMDLGSGLIVAPMTNQLLSFFIEKDPEITQDATTSAMVKQLLGANSFYILMTLDMDKNPDRASSYAKNAKAVGTNGKTVGINQKGMEFFAGAMNEGDSKEFDMLVFPKLGEKGKIKLILENPEKKGEKLNFQWDLK